MEWEGDLKSTDLQYTRSCKPTRQSPDASNPILTQCHSARTKQLPSFTIVPMTLKSQDKVACTSLEHGIEVVHEAENTFHYQMTSFTNHTQNFSKIGIAHYTAGQLCILLLTHVIHIQKIHNDIFSSNKIMSISLSVSYVMVVPIKTLSTIFNCHEYLIKINHD